MNASSSGRRLSNTGCLRDDYLDEGTIDAMRSLLYETTRFVDIYKAYNLVAEHRKLDADERNDQKYYQKLADVFTPLLKLISSEYCNAIAYDALQVHGGTGFMKDFPIERIYRDARITSIYEGTSQLQVVAAIRGVTSGAYLKAIRDYEARPVMPDVAYLKDELVAMTEVYEEATAMVDAFGSSEATDFHARRLVEMAGNIIMGYLLLHDSLRDEEFTKPAALFIARANAANAQSFAFIKNFDLKDLGHYKVFIP